MTAKLQITVISLWIRIGTKPDTVFLSAYLKITRVSIRISEPCAKRRATKSIYNLGQINWFVSTVSLCSLAIWPEVIVCQNREKAVTIVCWIYVLSLSVDWNVYIFRFKLRIKITQTLRPPLDLCMFYFLSEINRKTSFKEPDSSFNCAT